MCLFHLPCLLTPSDTEGPTPSAETHITNVRDGVPIGERADSEWLYVVPWGLRRLLNYINKRYHHPVIYITENGVDIPNESDIPMPQVLEDTFRINYFRVSDLVKLNKVG